MKRILILLCLPMIFGCGNNERAKEDVVNEIAINTIPLFYIYDDGTAEKKIIIE